MDALTLLPYELGNEQHLAELKRQRELCGWGMDEVPKWLENVGSGDKLLYWIVALDRSQYPIPSSEPNSLLPGIGPPPPDPSFQPLGHVALDREDYHDPPNKLLCSRESGNLMISNFFVLKSQQGRGLGNKVMDIVEGEARRLGAPEITLNTMQAKDATNPRFWEEIGVEYFPKARVNQYWYESRGYVVFEEDMPRYPTKMKDGKMAILNSVSMKKPLN